MKSILKDLWYGNIAPIDLLKDTDEMSEKRKELSILYDKLLRALTKEQKKLLEEYEECNIELCCLREESIFEYAFCLGMKLTLEGIK